MAEEPKSVTKTDPPETGSDKSSPSPLPSIAEQLLAGRRKLIVVSVATAMTLLLGLAGRMDGTSISATILGLLSEYIVGNFYENKILAAFPAEVARSFGFKKFWVAIGGLVVTFILAAFQKLTGAALAATLTGIAGVYVAGNMAALKPSLSKEE